MRLCIDHSVQAIIHVGVPTAQAVGAVPRPAALKQKANLINNLNSSCSSSSSSSFFSSPIVVFAYLQPYLASRIRLSLSCLFVFIDLPQSSLSLFSLSSPTLVTCLAPVFSPDWKSTQFARTAVSLLSHSTQRERCSLDLFSYCFALSLLLFTALIGNYTFFFFLFSF